MTDYIIAETDLLERELRQYEHIQLLLKRKQDFLVESNPEGIKNVTHEIEEVITRIKNLEKERSNLLDQFIVKKLTRPASDAISWRKTFPGDTTPEKDLTAAFRSNEKVKNRLRYVLDDISSIQNTNRLLIQQGRDVLQTCMECLLSQVSQETYTSKGATRKVDLQNNMIDKRI